MSSSNDDQHHKRSQSRDNSQTPLPDHQLQSGWVDSFWNATEYVWSYFTSTPPPPQPEISSAKDDENVQPIIERRASISTKPCTRVILSEPEYGIKMLGRSPDADPADMVLTKELLAKLHGGLPPRWRICSTWQLLYSTSQNGFSLGTLLHQTRLWDGPVLIAIRDSYDACFGAFCTEPPSPHPGHFGTGECFLWRSNKTSGYVVTKYGTTGKNDYFILCETGFFALGVGDGQFGLWLDEALEKGESHPVPTFDNEVLASSSHFSCVALEVWGLDRSAL